MTEIDQQKRSLTPCLDENRDEGNGGENSKEIELSDISDDEEEWPDQEAARNGNGNGKSGEKFGFKKITRSNRDRNYRYKQDEKGLNEHSSRKKKSENYRRKEIQRYDVRKVVATRDFSISRSRSRSISTKPTTSRYQDTFSPRRDAYNRRSQSRPFHIKTHRYSPVSSRHSPSSTDRYRNYQQYTSPTPEKSSTRRSRSKHKHNKLKLAERDEKIKKQRSSKDHQHKNKKSLSLSTPSPELSSPSRQIMSVTNSNLTQENIKVILKNNDISVRRQKMKKRDKKTKREKSSRKEKYLIEQQQKKEVFASGDNILISVYLNNNNNNDDNNSHKVIDDKSKDERTSGKSKSKRQPSPASSAISSANSYTRNEQKRQRKHKHKKISSRKERDSNKEPKTPPPLKPLNLNAISTTPLAKRKNDMKPIAIIDLEKSPGKEIILSPKEIIVLSDSDGNFESVKKQTKDIIIVEDITINEKGNHQNHSAIDLLSPKHATPESPPAALPVLKFALKSKSNILPFNLLHDQADEIEEPPLNTSNLNANISIISNESVKSSKEQQENIVSNDNKHLSNLSQNDAYDPFEPTKSRSISPMTPPHPHPNDISSSSDTLKNKIDSLNEKIQKESNLSSGIDVHPSASIWIRKEFDGKKNSLLPLTPPIPSYIFPSGSNSQISKQPNVGSSLYDGIYGSDLKTPVLPSPSKSNLKYINNKKNIAEDDDDDDDDDDDYSPSSDGFDNEQAPLSMHTSGKNAFETIKHSDIDTQSSEPSGSYSFNADDTTTTTKTTPLKLTASTLKTFNSTMRSTGPLGLNFKGIYENFLPTSQVQNPSHAKRQTMATENSHFIRSKVSRFSSNLNENGSPLRNIMSYNEPLKPSVIDESMFDDEVPSSAVDLVNKDKFLKKSLRIERVAEEVKLVLKPHYNKKHITKDEYKMILRKSVPKICHNKTGEINIQKITQLIEAYIKKFRYKRKAGISSIASSI